MAVVYHAVPRDMIGDTIYPLGELGTIDPALQEGHRAKYAGRREVLDVRLPGTDVGFNDAVHCAPIHPNRLFTLRRSLGMTAEARPASPAWMTGLFFEIPIERILVHPVVWYAWRALWINGAPGEDVPLAPPVEEFEPFDAARYAPLTDVPPSHEAYLRRMQERGERALMFVHIPHVLVVGPIAVGGLRVVGWDEPPSIT